MDAAVLVFTWFWLNQQPVSSQISFSSMALCQEARQTMLHDRKRALEDSDAPQRVPQLAIACIAAGPAKPAHADVSGLDWLMSQPVTLLDWGLQKLANTADAVRSVTIPADRDGVAGEDNAAVDFSLIDSGGGRFAIQGTMTPKSAEQLTERHCRAALKVWRQTVLGANRDKPAASIDEWFSHADRNAARRPKNLAETVAASFEFRMTLNGIDVQPAISCATPFTVDPDPPTPAPPPPPRPDPSAKAP